MGSWRLAFSGDGASLQVPVSEGGARNCKEAAAPRSHRKGRRKSWVPDQPACMRHRAGQDRQPKPMAVAVIGYHPSPADCSRCHCSARQARAEIDLARRRWLPAQMHLSKPIATAFCLCPSPLERRKKAPSCVWGAQESARNESGRVTGRETHSCAIVPKLWQRLPYDVNLQQFHVKGYTPPVT